MTTQANTANVTTLTATLTIIIANFLRKNADIGDAKLIKKVVITVREQGFSTQEVRVHEVTAIAERLRAEMGATKTVEKKAVVMAAVEAVDKLTDAEVAAIKSASTVAGQFSPEQRRQRSVAWATWKVWLETNPLALIEGKVDRLVEVITKATQPDTTAEQLSAVIKVDRAKRYEAVVATKKQRAQLLARNFYMYNPFDKRELYKVASCINGALSSADRVPEFILRDALYDARKAMNMAERAKRNRQRQVRK